MAAAFAAECDQSRVRFVDGAGDALDRLHGRGYDLWLVTNGPPATQRRKLDSLEPSETLRTRVSGNTATLPSGGETVDLTLLESDGTTVINRFTASV